MARMIAVLFIAGIYFFCAQPENIVNEKFRVNKDSVLYVKKCVEFLKQIMPNELADTGYVLSDKPSSLEYFDCMKNLVSDTVTYTKEEIALFKANSKPLITRWTKEIFPIIKIINTDTIYSKFKDRSKFWEYFKRHIGRSLNRFSLPIFFRNDTYCLFYQDHSCGFLCGDGKLILYKKENNKWIEVKTYCQWIS